jgi:hypothetical protein
MTDALRRLFETALLTERHRLGENGPMDVRKWVKESRDGPEFRQSLVDLLAQAIETEIGDGIAVAVTWPALAPALPVNRGILVLHREGNWLLLTFDDEREDEQGEPVEKRIKTRKMGRLQGVTLTETRRYGANDKNGLATWLERFELRHETFADGCLTVDLVTFQHDERESILKAFETALDVT